MEVVLVHGGSGTGKSTLVTETIQKSLSTNASLVNETSNRSHDSGSHHNHNSDHQHQEQQQQQQQEQEVFAFGEGQFDPLRETARPFAALCTALTQLCTSIQRDGILTSRDRTNLQKELLMSAVGEDRNTLMKLVPSIASLLFPDAITNNNNNNNHHHHHHNNRLRSFMGDAPKKIKKLVTPPPTPPSSPQQSSRSTEKTLRIFRSVVKALCDGQSSCPVVLFLDDLHKADQQSVELFQSLAMDTDRQGLLLIGSYRDTEVSVHLNDCLSFMKRHHKMMVQQRKRRQQQQQLLRQDDAPPLPIPTLTHVLCDNIDATDLHELLIKLLDRRHESVETQQLADEVYKKTEGNCFFVIQFLMYLLQRGFLKYDVPSYQWTWDIAQVRARTGVSDNVVEIVLDRINLLLGTAKRVLTDASLLGSTFDADFVARMIFEEEKTKTKTDVVNDNNDMDWLEPEELDQLLAMNALDKSVWKRSTSVDSVNNMPDSLDGIRIEIEQQLDLFVDLGLVQHGTGSWYHFRHDRIQQAAYDLVPPGEKRANKHLRIGRLLRQVLQEETPEDWMFFGAVDHLNLGMVGMDQDEERLGLARLNLEASTKAMENSAIFPAASYAFAGLTILELSCHNKELVRTLRKRDHLDKLEDLKLYDRSSQKHVKWDLHYQLSLELASACAEFAYGVGKFQICRAVTDEVLRSANNLEDKLRVYLTRIDLSGSRGRLHQAVEEGRRVLEMLGEKFPTTHHVQSVQSAMRNTKRALGRGGGKKALQELPEMTDGNTLNAMKVLSLVSSYASLNEDEQLVHLAQLMVLRMVQITVKHGLCPYTPVAYAGYGVILTYMEDSAAGCSFGETALQLMDESEQTILYAKVSLLVHSALKHRTTPLALTLEPLLKAYNVGMATGEVEDALLCALVYSHHYYYSGLPLEPLLNDLREYIKLMHEYRQDVATQTARPLFQLVLNLTGDSSDPLELNGSGMVEDLFNKEIAASGNTVAIRNYLWARLQVAYLFGYSEQARVRLQELTGHKETQRTRSTFGYCDQTFFEALTLIDLVRRSQHDLVKKPQQRAYKASIRKAVKRMEKWVDDGAINCKDMLLLVRAEDMSLVKNKPVEEKVRAYELAITTAGRHGKTQLRAMASERAAKFMFQTKGRYDQAEMFLANARDLYAEWGAKALVTSLEQKHRFLATTSSSANNSSGISHNRNFRGRERFHKSTVDQHRTLPVPSLGNAYGDNAR